MSFNTFLREISLSVDIDVDSVRIELDDVFDVIDLVSEVLVSVESDGILLVETVDGELCTVTGR